MSFPYQRRYPGYEGRFAILVLDILLRKTPRQNGSNFVSRSNGVHLTTWNQSRHQSLTGHRGSPRIKSGHCRIDASPRILMNDPG
jgi:hypothetical protein